MAVNPLEALMSVVVAHQLVSSSTAEPGAVSASASLHGRKPNTRSSSQEARKWPVCASRPTSGSVCGSSVPTKTLKSHHSPENAARERSRVQNLRQAFHSLQAALPSVPPDTKLSQLDILVLATDYIAYLTETLDRGATPAEFSISSRPGGYLHPVKKWPMRSLLYCSSVSANQRPSAQRDGSDLQADMQ